MTPNARCQDVRSHRKRGTRGLRLSEVGNSLFTGVWVQQERPTWQQNHTRTLTRSSDTPGPGPAPALCRGITYTLHQPQETEERLKPGDTAMPNRPQPVSLLNTYKCITDTSAESAVSQSPPNPAVQMEAPPQPSPKPWRPRHPPLPPQLRLSQALQQQHYLRHRHPPTPAGPIPEDVGRPEPGPTQPAEPTDSHTSDSQSLHTCVRFGKPPGPVHTHPVPLQPAPSQVPQPPRGPEGAGSHTRRRRSPGLRRTHLGATPPWRTTRESEVAPDRRALGTGTSVRLHTCAPAARSAPLTTHGRHCFLPVSAPAATRSRDRLSAPFLTPVSALFNLNIYSAVQTSSSETVTVLNLLKIPSAPTMHEFRFTSNSTENPKAAAGQLQAQPTCVLPAAKNGFHMCKV